MASVAVYMTVSPDKTHRLNRILLTEIHQFWTEGVSMNLHPRKPTECNYLSAPHRRQGFSSCVAEVMVWTSDYLPQKTMDMISCPCFNTLRRRQNGHHFQMTFSNAFSWMKILKFQLECHWNLFPRVQLIIFQHWFRQWLGADQATSHYLNQWWLVYWRIYVSLGLNELITINHVSIRSIWVLIVDEGKQADWHRNIVSGPTIHWLPNGYANTGQRIVLSRIGPCNCLVI